MDAGGRPCEGEGFGVAVEAVGIGGESEFEDAIAAVEKASIGDKGGEDAVGHPQCSGLGRGDDSVVVHSEADDLVISGHGQKFAGIVRFWQDNFLGNSDFRRGGRHGDRPAKHGREEREARRGRAVKREK